MPFARLILGAVLMGLGISGMHYTGMMGLMVKVMIFTMTHWSSPVLLWLLFAVPGLTFWLAFKNKLNQYRNLLAKLAVSAALTMTIVSMHFIIIYYKIL